MSRLNYSVYILGAGITGLAAGFVSDFPVFEAGERPGGICSSYYMRPGDSKRVYSAPKNGEAYRFEIGGGHWIFGGDPAVLRFIRSLTPVKFYTRRSSVFFSRRGLYVPYPLQNHLGYLGRDIAARALNEIASAPRGNPATMSEWLEQNFGKTLTDLFFAPFHELYTAGLWTRIAPQDAYKSPVELALIVQGAFDKTPPVGYNATFIYPVKGLNTLIQRMAAKCQIYYNKKAVKIDVRRKEIHFSDGSGVRYETLISSLPLNRIMEMTSLQLDSESDPYTSVLVLNIGATKGPKCPVDHWLYIPDSRSGFYRVGFYSNVDSYFLPKPLKADDNRVSIYVEKAFPCGKKPSKAKIQVYIHAVVKELQEWKFIKRPEAIDATWIDVAYTWCWPGSTWKKRP